MVLGKIEMLSLIRDKISILPPNSKIIMFWFVFVRATLPKCMNATVFESDRYSPKY